jgi:hypothetical protein
MSDDPERLNALASPRATVAGKIRALAAAGVPRADIAASSAWATLDIGVEIILIR